MLPFFRRIRKQLFSSGTITRYVLYGTGEILLVMVGILLALQVNNWNEYRKAKVFEYATLKELLMAMENNQSEIEFSRHVIQSALQECERIIEKIENNKDEDTLANYSALLYWTSYNMASGPYEVLKSRGLENITNDTIRYEVYFLYENLFDYLKEVEKRNHDLHYNILHEVFQQHFDRVCFDCRMLPLNKTGMLEDPLFSTTIRTIREARIQELNAIEDIYERIGSFMQKLSREIESRF